MKKLLVILTVLLVPITVYAVPAPKVFVCKYVGTPGVDERLQTGQNPISVSQNAIKDFQGIGSYFNDQHGRSYVLIADNGQTEPDVSECPKTDNPTSPPAPSPSPNPTPNPTPNPSPTPEPTDEPDSVPNLNPSKLTDYPGVK